ncbi:MAG TPA: SDR family NAD(P)-dependent oxidoreductase [Candidatus Polarisedimenticolaceae bacterium]|nr:SDR family NAD(P)-dependent oxidoreductase [Candidatus Polarisedimenticolaceae bacterium]
MSGTVALVTGASRGIGRAIARALGETRATVYVTGRTVASEIPPEPGTIEHVARDVDRLGGHGIAVRCDHEHPDEIGALFAKVASESGQLDLLVNNVHSGMPDLVAGVGRPFWETDPAVWERMNGPGLRGHYVAAVHAARLMVPARRGLIVNVSSFCAGGYLLSVPYGVGKAALDRMTADLAHELLPHGVAVVSVWPGLVRTDTTGAVFHEAAPRYRRILDAYGETPERTGRAVAALASDPRVLRHSGRALIAAEVMRDYRVFDDDGRYPPSPRSLTTLASALLPDRFRPLAALVPPVRVPRFVVARVLTRFSDHLRARGGFK